MNLEGSVSSRDIKRICICENSSCVQILSTCLMELTAPLRFSLSSGRRNYGSPVGPFYMKYLLPASPKLIKKHPLAQRPHHTSLYFLKRPVVWVGDFRGKGC